MALIEAGSLMFSAAIEVASLVWMELTMFGMAALIYVLCIGGSPLPVLKDWLAKAKSMDDSMENLGEAEVELRSCLARGDHKGVLRCWQSLKNKDEEGEFDLASVVHSMQKLGHSGVDIIGNLRSALTSSPVLLPNVATLPAALLRDDAVDLLDGVTKLLEEHGQSVDTAVYAGLMSGHMRRRDYAAVSAVADRLAPESFNPRMRAMLAAAATHRGRLDEALGHIRQMPVTLEGTRCALPPAAVVQLLTLATKEQRVAAVTLELQRTRAKLETKQLDDLLLAEVKRSKGKASCQDLVDVGIALNIPKGAGTYQALASAFASSGDSASLRSLFDELDGEVGKGSSGLAVGEPLALALLEAAKTLHDGHLINRVVALHRLACAGAPGARVLSCACAALISFDRCEVACDFYETEMASKGVWPDASLTGPLLKAAAQAGRSALAQRLSDHAGTMKSSAPGSAAAAKDELSRHAAMIKAYARERDLPNATKIYTTLCESGTPLSSLIYNSYLDACVQCGDLAAAIAQFESMKQLGNVDVVGYNTLLKAYLSKGCAEEAHSLVKEMTAAGFQANKVTYNELLHARVMAKDGRGTWGLVDEMQKSGVRANSVTCAILLKSLTTHSDPEDVKRVINLIDDVEEAIDEVLFSSVIEACIRIRQLPLLSDLMRRYRHKGAFVNLTAPTYGSMIKAYGQAGDVARVRELWHEMEERGVKPTSITLGCMTEALVVNSQPEEALELIHAQLESDDRKGCINTVIYSTVLKGFAVCRRIDKVFVVYKEMRNANIPCNTITYNTMLDACAKCCTMSHASDLLEDMKESCVEPDIITYSTIVKGYCLEGDVDRAFSVLEDMKGDEKFAPDEIMYNSILDGCAKQHRVEDALKLLEEMKTTGVVPSNYTLSILVKLLGHARRLNQAFRMVEDLSTQHGFRPNVQVYTCLVQACVLNRRLEKAMALHDTMISDAGCRTDEKFYAVLTRGCLQLHQPLKAVEVIRAAYQLPGHSLAQPSRPGRPVGVEARALEEVASKLQTSGKDDQEVLEKLMADLLEHRGVRLGEGHASKGGNGKGNTFRDEGARRRGGRGGANRGGK
jgi:pentatricopeptide repeat protein